MSEITYKTTEYKTVDCLNDDGYLVAAYEAKLGEVYVSYGPSLGITRVFATEGKARHWIETNAGDLADSEFAQEL